MDNYPEDIESGKIHFRDKWQFELKSDLYPIENLKETVLSQEFYFFIPNALQIQDQTYSKEQFYQDQTNLFRFKTPEFSLSELLDFNNTISPLIRLKILNGFEHNEANKELLHDEIKLLGTIFHSSLRAQIAYFEKRLSKLEDTETLNTFISEFTHFCDTLKEFKNRYRNTESQCKEAWSNIDTDKHFEYLAEFISSITYDYLAGFLFSLRQKTILSLQTVDDCLCEILANEKNFIGSNESQKEPLSQEEKAEYLLYRKGLLNKFVIDPLLLKISRSSVEQKYRSAIGILAAGIAMLLYMVLFVLLGNVFVINSQPFVLLTVVIYILKDRIKEGLKYLSHRKAAQWFLDYTTEIRTPEDVAIGTIREAMTFVEDEALPQEIVDIRHRQFHAVLESIKRPERVIYYKKTINIKHNPKETKSRFYGLNIIFRLDIHKFLYKAEDPFQIQLSLEPETRKLRRKLIPKVYHINIITRETTWLTRDRSLVVMKKYRLVIDKTGIKRVEAV